MLENGIGSVPVVSGEGMIGIVSKADFVTLAVGIAFDKITVKEIMTGDVVAVSPTDRLIHARRLMIDAHIGRVPVNLLAVFLIFPKFLRDFGYNLVAKNRYRFFGKQKNCWIPSKELQNKFLS